MEIIPVIHIIDEHQVVENIRTILNCGINKVFFIDHNGGYKRPIMFAKDCKYNVKKWCGTKLAIFTSNAHTKHKCLLNHKTVIRSTEPPIFFRCC